MESSSKRFGMSLGEQERSWADLPSLILSSIMEELVWEMDYVRFGAVCVPWHTAFLQHLPGNAKKHSSPPFLLIPPCCIASQKKKTKTKSRKRPLETNEEMPRSLYSISKNKVCDFQVRLPRGNKRYTVASSLGWLLTMKLKIYPKEYGIGKVMYHVRLHNPFLPDADHIHLPKLPFQNIHLSRAPIMYIRKAVLSSPPDNNLNKNFVLMAIVGDDSKLAFFNPATKQFCWTAVGDNYKRMPFCDVIYFNKAHQFYAVVHESGAVYAIGIECQDQRHPKLTLVAPPTDGVECFLTRFLVESPSGDLLQIIKVPDVDVPSTNPNLAWFINFEVWKFDFALAHWLQIHDIGDATLFIGCNSSIARHASNFPNCVPNSVYFTTGYNFFGNITLEHHDYNGIYNLEDGSVQPHYSMCSKMSSHPPIWLEPTIKK